MTDLTKEQEASLVEALDNGGLFNEKQERLRACGLAIWDMQQAECLSVAGQILAQALKERDEARARVDELETAPNNTCTIHWWGDAHDGAGWYYVDDEYPEEGSVGSFLHLSECIQHARAAGYLVADASDSQLVEGMRVVEVAEPSDTQQAKADAWDEGYGWGVMLNSDENPYRKDGE